MDRPISYDGISYHVDHAIVRVEMCCLRIVAWTYGFTLFFLFSLGIFPDISKLYVMFFAFQVPYVMFLITLAQRQRLRHAVLVFILTAFILIANGGINFIPVIWLVEPPILSGFYKNFHQSNHAAFVWTVVLTLLLFILNIATLYISFRAWRIFRNTLPLSHDPLTGEYTIMRPNGTLQQQHNHDHYHHQGTQQNDPAQIGGEQNDLMCSNCGTQMRRRINDPKEINLQFHD